MPKLDPKKVQKELESGLVWPVYWIYGSERMKIRELLKRIKKSVLGDAGGGFASFDQELFDATEVTSSELLDVAQSLSLGFGAGGAVRFFVVREAHLLKDPESLLELLGPPRKREELSHCCVFVAKDLDARKKFSKALIEKAAVVPCEEVPEEEREAWIQYLAKRRELDFPLELSARLRGLDPWNLDSVDQELEKYALALQSDSSTASEVLLGGVLGEQGADAFVDALFTRKRSRALALVSQFAENPEEALPLLGLLGWNVRHLFVAASDRVSGARSLKLSPFLSARFEKWARHWSPAEVQELQSSFADLDFSLKQTPKQSLALWTELVCRFS